MAADAATALRRHRALIKERALRHGFLDVRVFGSVARGEGRKGSDLDLLVRPGPETSLLDLIALEQDLEEALGVRVQVVSERGLHPLLRERVLSEAVPV